MVQATGCIANWVKFVHVQTLGSESVDLCDTNFLEVRYNRGAVQQSVAYV